MLIENSFIEYYSIQALKRSLQVQLYKVVIIWIKYLWIDEMMLNK
jgi:hypothetical protein